MKTLVTIDVNLNNPKLYIKIKTNKICANRETSVAIYYYPRNSNHSVYRRFKDGLNRVKVKDKFHYEYSFITSLQSLDDIRKTTDVENAKRTILKQAEKDIKLINSSFQKLNFIIQGE